MSTPTLQFPYVRRDLSSRAGQPGPMLPLTLIGRQNVAISGCGQWGSRRRAAEPRWA